MEGVKLNFEELMKKLQPCVNLGEAKLKAYLQGIYKGLLSRIGKKENGKKTLSKVIFAGYLNLPMIICDKLFRCFNYSGSGNMSKSEFVQGMYDLYFGTLQKMEELTFQFYDFNNDGKIWIRDVILISKYIINCLQVEIDQESLINDFFEASEYLTYEEYTLRIEKNNSNVFLLFLMFIHHNQPFTRESINYFPISNKNLNSGDECLSEKMYCIRGESSKEVEKEGNSPSEIFSASKEISDCMNKLFKKPIVDIRRKRASNFLQNLAALEQNEEVSQQIKFFNASTNSVDVKKSPKIQFNKIVCVNNFNGNMSNLVNIHNRRQSEIKISIDYCEDKNLKKDNNLNTELPLINMSPEKKSKFSIPKIASNSKSFGENNLTPIVNKHHRLSNPNIQINPIKLLSLNYNSQKDMDRRKSISSVSSDNSENPTTNEAYFYKLDSNGKISKRKLILVKNDLYSFKKDKVNKESEISYFFEGVTTLKGVYMAICDDTKINGRIFHTFALVVQWGNTTVSLSNIFFCKDKNEMENFVKLLKESVNIKDIDDYYEIKQCLGKGQYGNVKLGKDKKSGLNVAVKIMTKSTIDSKLIYMIRSEIDILKFLGKVDHPNVIKFYDVFEDKNSIYLVMEYFECGSLKDFLFSLDSTLEEAQVKTVAFEVAKCLQFFDSVGIIHRDIKPENILISGVTSKKLEIKIADFGLSKIIGDSEFATEGYGTLVYSAPDILLNKNYNRKVDVWSFGVLLYFLSTGKLPFREKVFLWPNFLRKFVTNLYILKKFSIKT